MKSKFDEVASRHCNAYANILQEATSGPFRQDARYKIENPAFVKALTTAIQGLKTSSPAPSPVDLDNLNQLLKRCKSGYVEFLEVANYRTSNGTRGDPIAVATTLYNKVAGNTASGGFGLNGSFTPYKRPYVAPKTTTPGVAKNPSTSPNTTDPSKKAGNSQIGQKIVAGHKDILNTLDKSAPTIQTR